MSFAYLVVSSCLPPLCLIENNVLHLKKLRILTKNAMLISSGCDTSRPLGILFRPFKNNARGTKYHRHCSGHSIMTLCFEYYKHMSLVQLSSIFEELLCVELENLQSYRYGGFFTDCLELICGPKCFRYSCVCAC